MADPLEPEGQVEPEQRTLFELPPVTAAEPQLKQLPHPIWTENKAKLIAKYIHLFLMITKHGTYIDGFAGPQQPEKPEMWAAKLVLDVEPKWLRHFYLFEKRKAGCDLLKYLKASHVGPAEREVEVFCGDFNEEIDKLLNSGRIGQKEATFCLLDQRTFECHWKTVEKLARYKMAGNNKIELFYFLAGWWYRRAVTAIKDESVLTNWWGRDDWSRLRTMKLHEVRDEIVSRFKSELLYMSAMAWPILDRNGRDMYYMIHTTDHSEAPMQMRRAYEQAVQPTTPPLQSEFWP
jgi:three-Cys-motif partner protein